MPVSLDLTLSHLIQFGLLFVGAVWTLLKLITAARDRRLDERLSALTEAIRSLTTDLRLQSDERAKMERDFMAFKAEMPLHYVRREDYVPAMAAIMARLDAITLRFENILLLLRGEKRD
jgi:hypothetical protein